MGMNEVSIIGPTLERTKRGPVELLNNAIADEAGNPSQPWRSIDLLSAMERRGAITAEMRQAGEQFRNEFTKAHLDQLKATDWSRPYVTGRIRSLPGGRVEDARQKVWEALEVLGGISSCGGSCVWHVIGLGETLKQWATESHSKRGMRQETASGVLLCALGSLQRFYGL